MAISPSEKLILSMLAALLEKLDIEPQTARFVKAAIATDNTWALSWEFPEFFGEHVEPFPAVVADVTNYLHMWTCIEKSLKILSNEERIDVERAAMGRTNFPGFDGDQECDHFNAAHFLIHHMRRFPNFRDIELDANYPTLQRTELMHRNFEALQSQCNVRSLVKAELISIFQA